MEIENGDSECEWEVGMTNGEWGMGKRDGERGRRIGNEESVVSELHGQKRLCYGYVAKKSTANKSATLRLHRTTKSDMLGLHCKDVSFANTFCTIFGHTLF